jgi:hypothetical protein
MLKGVSVALRTLPNPPCVIADDSLAKPACAPSAAPTRLVERGRDANHGGGGVVHPAHRIEIVLQSIARRRLDDHPAAVGLQRLAHMARRADRIAHVMQAVEESHQIQVLAWKIARHGDFELTVGGCSVLLGMNPRLRHRVGVKIVADKRRFRKGFRHDDSRKAVTATNVSHFRAAFEFRADAARLLLRLTSELASLSTT